MSNVISHEDDPDVIRAQRRAFGISDTAVDPVEMNPNSRLGTIDHSVSHMYGSALAHAAADLRPILRQFSKGVDALSAIASSKDCPEEVKNMITSYVENISSAFDSESFKDALTDMDLQARALVTRSTRS